jgi:hypothetical protein
MPKAIAPFDVTSQRCLNHETPPLLCSLKSAPPNGADIIKITMAMQLHPDLPKTLP